MPENISGNESSDIKIVQTDVNSKNGQNKCPKCGATDIELNVRTGKLRCNYCRHEFDAKAVEGLETNINELKGQVVASGAQNIVADTKDILTLKCSSCGAEVVIDTSEATQARCHWCRHTLSINQQIPNGSIPDVVLPFKITKQEAQTAIEQFVHKRKFFANPKFKEEFTTANIMGVYFPYLLVDANAHAYFKGQGEHLVRSYTVGDKDDSRTYYDADLYAVERDFDITVNELSIESNSDRLNTNDKTKTNNIINSIMPFDTENCVKWDANYLRGYSSEKRDTNIDQIKSIVDSQTKDIARFAANPSLTYYDRGVAWETQNLDIKGQQWKAAYLPVWLYSYQQIKDNKSLLHYVAVNARTKETMGSVPIHMPKLFVISLLVELIGIILMLLVDFDNDWIFLTFGLIYYAAIYARYRNANARHNYETETKNTVTNLKKVDQYIKRRTRLENRMISGVNNKSVEGVSNQSKIINNLVNNNKLAGLVSKGIEQVNKDKK